MNSEPDELARFARRAKRERTARKEAEQLLEAKSLELYQANLKLKDQAELLEAQVAARTHELKEALKSAEAATKAKSDFLTVIEAPPCQLPR
ncbi:MAG: hypothetical protein AAF558_05315 [Verrucomicrobiota bacterium]